MQKQRNLGIVLFSVALLTMLFLTCLAPTTLAAVTSKKQPENSKKIDNLNKQFMMDKDQILKEIQTQEEPPEHLRLDDYDWFAEYVSDYGTAAGGQCIDPDYVVDSSDSNVGQMITDDYNEESMILVGTDDPVGCDVRVRMCYKDPEAYFWDNVLILYISPNWGSTWYLVNWRQATDDEPTPVGYGWNDGVSYVEDAAIVCYSWTYYPMLEHWILVDSISFENKLYQ